MVRPATATRHARARLEAALERLLEVAHDAIAELDVLDGDPDLEPLLAAAEQHPTAGRYSTLNPTQEHWGFGAVDDREQECEDEGAQCDDEGVSGIHDPDREPEADREPDHEHEACAWQDEGDQTTLTAHPVHVWRTGQPGARPQAAGGR